MESSSNNKIIKTKLDKNNRIKKTNDHYPINSEIEGTITDFNSESQDPANVISFGGTLENSLDQDQIQNIKNFVRDARINSDKIDMEGKNEMLDLIDSNANAYNQFNTLTKIKYFYLKHEWTFIAIREFSAIAIIITSFLLYSSSLNTEKNYNNYNMYFYYPMTLFSLIKCLIAGGIVGFIIFSMFAEWIFLEHLIYMLIVYSILIYKNFGNNILNHGKYNFLLFFLSSILIFFLLLGIYMIYKFSRTIKYLYLIITVLAFFFCFLICYNFKYRYENNYSCEKWSMTLNNSYIFEDEKNEKCNLEKIKGMCYMDKIFDYFDLTLANNIKCENREENEKENFYGMIKDESLLKNKIFGFPSTININKGQNGNNTKNLQHYIFNNLKSIERINNDKIDNLNFETIIDFSNNDTKGELTINLNKNKTLSEERKKISQNLENKNTSIYDNILLIFLSSVSRAHFQRGLPKLSKFISKLMSYEPFPTMTSYQFSKYKNFPFTMENIKSIFYKKESDSDINSLQYFKESGYVTGQVGDICDKIMNNKNSIEWDHENYVMACDPNFFQKKEFSVYERCLYGKPMSEYMIDYAQQFWDKYSDNKKYFRMIFNYGNEPTGNVIKYLDEPLYNMIWGLYNEGKLKNTAVFILSEQGNKNNGLYDILGSAEFEIEKRYGVFIMILDWNEKFKNGKYHKNLIKNQNLFITPYDVYDTMVHIIIGDKYKKGNSVLNGIKMEDTYCYNI